MINSGISRISREATTSDFGPKPYYLARFLPKLYENEGNWTESEAMEEALTMFTSNEYEEESGLFLYNAT